MVSAEDMKAGNIFGGFDIGLGEMGSIILIIVLAVLIVGLAVSGIVLYLNNKKYKYKVPLYKKVGSVPIKIATYKARDFPIGNAGDKLWFVKKAKKYISPGMIQTAPNEYPHFEREDGEWINFGLGDIDQEFKEAGIKYLHQDMRANRIAISQLLEQRFNKNSFWDKYGNMIVNVIFYLVIAIAMVVIFYQWSDIVDKTSVLMDRIVQLEEQRRTNPGNEGVVPAVIMLFGGVKRWVSSKH